MLQTAKIAQTGVIRANLKRVAKHFPNKTKREIAEYNEYCMWVLHLINKHNSGISRIGVV